MKVVLETFIPLKNKDSGYMHGERFYPLAELLEIVDDQKPKVFKACLNSMLHQNRWNEINAIDLAEHYNRINNSDLKYPIIMDYDGKIIDGFHRVTKAILKGHTHIKAVKILLHKAK